MLPWIAAAAAASTAADGNPWIAAGGGLAGGLIGALIAGGVRIYGDKAARRAESQRTALYELQLAGLELRRTLANYGQSSSPTDEDDEKTDTAYGKFELHLERIICEQVREHALGWSKLVGPFYTNDPDVTFDDENRAWIRLQTFVGQEIRRTDL